MCMLSVAQSGAEGDKMFIYMPCIHGCINVSCSITLMCIYIYSCMCLCEYFSVCGCVILLKYIFKSLYTYTCALNNIIPSKFGICTW